MKSSALALVVLSLSFIACDKVKKLDDMAKATDNLEKQTAEMERNTSNTGVMYLQNRTERARNARLTEISVLQNEKTLVESKCTAAAAYFKAFEFQLVTEEELLDERFMNSVKKDAASEFIRFAGDLYSTFKVKDLDPTKDLNAHQNEAIFYSIAASLHINSHYQEEFAAKVRIPVVSMYDIMKSALKKDKIQMDARDKKESPLPQVSTTPAEQVLLTGIRKEIMIELLKARVDFLSAIALKYMSDKRAMELGEFLKGLTFKISFGRLGGIDLPITINEANEETKKEAFTALEGAVKARRFLKNELKIEKKLQKTIRSAFKHVQLQTENDRELEKLNKLIEELLK